MTLRSAILAAVTGETAQETDPYYNLVSLHLKGDVNTGRSYNAFSDASSNNFRLTNNGDVRGSSFSPYGTSWSNYFSGSSQYLSVADSAAFTLGSGDFTVEAWVYKTSTGRQAITGQTDSAGANTSASFGLEINASNKVVGSICSGATGYLATSTADIVLNQWNHIAFVRDGNTLRIYINGVQDGTASVTGITVNDSTNQLAIGRIGEYASLYWTGYISNCRLVKGRCVYPSGTTFNPPTAPLTRTTGGTNPPQGTECSLLTCQSNRFIDNSIANTGGTPFTITPNGSPTVSSFSPFLETDTTSGSGYFDGTGDWLTAGDGAAAANLSGDSSIELWFYPLATNKVITAKYSGGTNQFFINADSSNKIYAEYLGSTYYAKTSSGSYTLNAWNHLLITKSSTLAKMWLNGVYEGSWTVSSVNSSTNAIGIGGTTIGGGTSFHGYISNAKYSNSATETGTSNITVPTAPLTATAGSTQLLTLQERGAYNTIGFQDESEYQHIITRPSGANVAQGTFSPFSQTGWGNYFNGSNAYLTAPNSTALDLSTGDFTVECWFYPTSWGTGVPIIYRYNGNFATGADLQYAIYTNSSGVVTVRPYQSTSDFTINAGTAVLNAWNHVALVRTGNTFWGFLNGNRSASSQTVTGALNNSTWSTFIGAALSTGSGNSFFYGYISNARITKGRAVYSDSSYTVPTAPLTRTTGGTNPPQGTECSLLTCQSNRFLDSNGVNTPASSPLTITPNGSPSVVAFSPFKPVAYDPAVHGGSGYFDGSGDYLTSASNSAFDFPGDFTLEAWIYLTAYSPSYSGQYGVAIFGRDVNSGVPSQRDWWFLITGTASSYTTISYNQFVGSTYTSNSQSYTFNLNTWYHVAAVKASGSVQLYVNGAAVGSAVALSASNTYGRPLYVGQSGYSGYEYYFPGYISNARIVKGTAVYTGNFTPPSGPLPLVNNTSLLVNFTNAGVIDSTGKNVIETVGNSGVVTTAIKKYGTGSMYFDGTDDRMVAPSSQNFAFGTGDFTIEAWVYATSAANYGICQVSDTVGGLKASQINTLAMSTYNNSVTIYANGTSYSSPNNSFSSNTWTHLAIVRNSNTTRLYINGTSAVINAGSTSITDNTNYTGTYIVVGGYYSTSYIFNGNIDDLRITKGYARYTTGTNTNAGQMVFNGTNTLALPTKALPDRGTLTTLTSEMVAPSTVEALVVAGGGGGGFNRGGGGGAGGYREFVSGNAIAVSAGTNYSLTIGGGGPGATAVGAAGVSGSNSVFSTITSSGGGGGGNAETAPNGGNGGSGGGAGGPGTPGLGNKITGTSTDAPTQGNNGGSGSNSAPNYGAGGGGGSNLTSGTGSNGTTTAGGNGGAGTASTITGTSITYAGGGGGATYNGGTTGLGGAGGGGAAGAAGGINPGTAGTNGLGGGGGGGSAMLGGPASGGSGGSGVVIIAYPSTFKPLKASLGLVYTIDTVTRPGYRVYKFTAGTGSISW